MTRRRRRGDRFYLLVYERMWQRWAWPCFLLVPASIVLWWFAPRISILHAPLRPLTLVPGAVAACILCYAFLARRLAWVQCRPGHLRIQTPILPLAVSYARLKEVRPKPFAEVFDPVAEKPARREWLHPYWRRTSLLVPVTEFPVSKRWLRLWFSHYLLDPKETGFVFLVDDWMGLSRQLDDYRITWGMQRKENSTRLGRFTR